MAERRRVERVRPRDHGRSLPATLSQQGSDGRRTRRVAASAPRVPGHLRRSDEALERRRTRRRISRKLARLLRALRRRGAPATRYAVPFENRSEEHTSELQSLMRLSYAVFCLKIKNKKRRRYHDLYT